MEPMQHHWWSRSLVRAMLAIALAATAAALPYSACAARQPAVTRAQGEALSKAEFAGLVQGLSEPGGFFHSDNFTSNETSYLHVVGAFQELGVGGGAYVGVGPEQNFSYIAKIRPRIAFIVDIRRQAMLQHLLYKALFQLSENRGEFLSSLLSRPLSGAAAKETARIEVLVDHFTQAQASAELYNANGARVRKLLEEELGLKLSDQDREQLNYVFSAFRDDGLAISFRFGQAGFGGYRRFPDLRELILEKDLKGNLGNFLASEEDYQRVRALHLQNRIVPLVGDFAGSKAFGALGAYLRKHGHTVSAFYTSNVEQFLFQNGVFPAFVQNVRALPIDENSVFIRAVPSRQPHPMQVSGHRTTTLLQRISVFLKDADAGTYPDYRTLVTTHFLAPKQLQPQ
jgi:hypothetical protein